MKPNVSGYIKHDRGRKVDVPPYYRKQRKRSGKRVFDKKQTRFRPKRAIRDNFTGEIVGWK